MGYVGRHSKKKTKSRSKNAAVTSTAAVAAILPITAPQPALASDTHPQPAIEKTPTLDQPDMTQALTAVVEEKIREQRAQARIRHQAAERAANARERIRARQHPYTKPKHSAHLAEKPAHKYAPFLVGAAKAISFATAQLGKPYVWGGTGPNAYDCSGLVQAAWAAAGVSIPRTSEEQWAGLHHVSTSDMKPGDLLIFYSGASHVGMYIGGGWMIEASNPSTPIKRARIEGYYMNNLLGVVRP